jgi:hypothetical protein
MNTNFHSLTFSSFSESELSRVGVLAGAAGWQSFFHFFTSLVASSLMVFPHSLSFFSLVTVKPILDVWS